LVTWLLGYRPRKKNRKKSQTAQVYSRKVLGYFDFYQDSVKKEEEKKEEKLDGNLVIWFLISAVEY